jgi:hypothetical protein
MATIDTDSDLAVKELELDVGRRISALQSLRDGRAKVRFAVRVALLVLLAAALIGWITGATTSVSVAPNLETTTDADADAGEGVASSEAETIADDGAAGAASAGGRSFRRLSLMVGDVAVVVATLWCCMLSVRIAYCGETVQTRHEELQRRLHEQQLRKRRERARRTGTRAVVCSVC